MKVYFSHLRHLELTHRKLTHMDGKEDGIFSVLLSKLDIPQQEIYVANNLLGMQPHSPLGVQFGGFMSMATSASGGFSIFSGMGLMYFANATLDMSSSILS